MERGAISHAVNYRITNKAAPFVSLCSVKLLFFRELYSNLFVCHLCQFFYWLREKGNFARRIMEIVLECINE